MADFEPIDVELNAVRERMKTFDILMLRTIAADDLVYGELAADELRRRGEPVQGYNVFARTMSADDKSRALGEA